MRGDILNGVALAAASLALVAIGFAWGRWRALVVVGALYSVPLVALDVLYFGFGINAAGYCGEPRCDPGPIPLTVCLFFLPAILGVVVGGVWLRRARRSDPTRS